METFFYRIQIVTVQLIFFSDSFRMEGATPSCCGGSVYGGYKISTGLFIIGNS